MAICGDRTVSCIYAEDAKAHIAERKKDNTNQVTVTFKRIKAKVSDGPVTSVGANDVDEGMVVYDFDAKTGDTYVKEISLWSDDGKRGIELCGRNYKFCKK